MEEFVEKAWEGGKDIGTSHDMSLHFAWIDADAGDRRISIVIWHKDFIRTIRKRDNHKGLMEYFGHSEK